MKKMILSSAIAGVLLGFANVSLAFNTKLSVSMPGSTPSGVSSVLGLIQAVAVIVAVIMVMYVGVKYLTAGASKKAEAKETMVPVLIGAVLVALAPAVVSWIFSALGVS